MKLIINTATTYKGGGIQVASSFIHECKNFEEHEYHIILGVGLAKIVETKDFPGNFYFYRIQYRPAQKVFSFKDQAEFLKDVEDRVRPDCVFTTSGPAYWRPKAPHVMGFNLPHYLYIDSPFFNKIGFKERMKWKLKGWVIKFYTKREADAFVTQTEDVNKRLKKWIGAKNVFTVSNTYGSQYDTVPTGPAQLPARQNKEFRFLILSGYYEHKNLEILNSIVSRLRDRNKKNIKFILTLPSAHYKTLIQDDHRDQVQNVGVLKPDDCPGIYRECDAIFLPTLLECFSATYAEAMKMKLPIVTTDLGFAHTVCGNAALYYSPVDPEDAVEKILDLYDNDELRKRLVKSGEEEIKKFNSAKERAEKYLEICNKINL